MRLISNRKRKALAVVIVTVFALLSVAGPHAYVGTGSGATNLNQDALSAAQPDGEALPALPEVVRLSWDNLPEPGAVVVGPASRVVLRVRNLTGETMRADITFTADDGGQKNTKQNFGSVTLGPSAVQPIQVDLRTFGFKLMGLRYSGQLRATARAFPDGTARYRQTGSPALYFHPTGGSDGSSNTIFYGEKSLLERFNAGDFRGRLSREELTEAGAVTSRVMFGGSGIVSSTPSGDNEPEEESEPDDEAVTGAITLQSGPTTQLTGGTANAGAYNYTTCVKFLIETVDSSVGIPNGPNAGGTEDYYQNANDGRDVIARGVAVRIWHGDSWQTYNADPTTGCFNWSHDETSDFFMRVYGKSTDEAGNYVRIHDDPTDFSDYPGDTYAWDFADVTPTNGAVNTFNVGSYNSEWTAMAVLGFGLYRYHGGLSGKAFHAGIDNTRSDGSSAHFGSGSSNASITSGRHYLRLGNDDDDDTPHTKYKFIVAHELGHAIAALYYGSHDDAVNGGEPPNNSTMNDHDVDPNSCGTGGTTYSISSKEWNSIGFREGFAHFIAPKIFNTKDSEGTFIWFANAHDLERYNSGGSNNAGGRLENQCCVGAGCAESWDSAGTNEDWMRFFWDFYTNVSDSCSAQPSKTDMLRLYRQTRLNGGLTRSNYFEKMQAAAEDEDLEDDMPECLRTTRFDFYAAHNGIDNE